MKTIIFHTQKTLEDEKRCFPGLCPDCKDTNGLSRKFGTLITGENRKRTITFYYCFRCDRSFLRDELLPHKPFVVVETVTTPAEGR